MNGLPGEEKFEKRIPAGDSRERLVCGDCGWVHYTNPKIIVGVVCTWEHKFLLCKRAIEPRVGFWTMPSGFMEEGETAEEGAAREALEEACAHVEIGQILAVYSVPRISQVQLVYRGHLTKPDVAPGPESSEVMLVEWEHIPWNDLAFPTVHWALNHYSQVQNQTSFTPFTTPPQALAAMRFYQQGPTS